MNIYETNYKNLTGLIEKAKQKDGYLKLEVKGYMPLVIEILEQYADKEYKISLAHYYEQNGDLIQDPELEIRVWDNMEMAEVLTYYQPAIGLHQEVYPEPGMVYPKIKKELNNFLKTWLKNLKQQGFMN